MARVATIAAAMLATGWASLHDSGLTSRQFAMFGAAAIGLAWACESLIGVASSPPPRTVSGESDEARE